MLRYNLKALVKRSRPAWARGKRRISLREIVPLTTHEQDLAAILNRVVRAWWNGSRDIVMPAYRTALEQARPVEPGVVLDDATQLGASTETIAQAIERLILELTPNLRDWVLRVENWHRGKWAASLTPVGVDLTTLLTPGDVTSTLEASLQTNVSLIRSISSEARARIEGIVFRGFNARTPARQIAREISEAVGLSRARALRIAADQTVKLSAQLDTARMLQAGIEEWTWIHSGKVHYRPWHKERDGKRYTWENAPRDLPGTEPFCGCRKRAELTLD